MDPVNLRLPQSLRSELKDPMGLLVKGSIEETIPKLHSLLDTWQGILVGVGDVTAEILVDQSFDPNIIITDGYTKREKLDVWRVYSDYIDVNTESPAAEITTNAWKVIKDAINQVLTQNSKIHVRVDGEEDLLVLPLILELPIGSKIIYGQPNQGAVVRDVTESAKESALSLLQRMDIIA